VKDRRRNALILLLVAGLVAASGVVIAVRKTSLGLDLKGGVELVYQGRPTAQAKVDSTSLNRAIDIMRKRVDQLGVAEPEIQTVGSDEIDVALPNVSNAQRAIAEVGKVAQLHFYDWETNVIGADGKAAGISDTTSTGDAAGDPGGAASGLTGYAAVTRAIKRPPIIRASDTTLEPGCTPKQVNGCVYGQWYLLNETGKTLLRGPEDTYKDLFSDRGPPPKGDQVRAVRVNPGTLVMQALPEVNATTGAVINANPQSFYVLNDNPALSGSDIRSPTASTDPTTGEPNVTFGFSSSGGKIFQDVTKAIAQRGQNAALPGVSKAEAEQHFAVALDNQLITVPYIDYTANPDGITAGAGGSEISGGFTLQSAQNLANELQSGALPIKLNLISESQVSATLGKQALNQGLLAGLIGFAVVALFLLVFYRVLGMIAIGALVIYGAYFFALIKLIPVTMTLAGIAGLILTIGVAADANIVIFERVKEEIRGGRSIGAGIAAGYQRGFAAIIDANVVTIMVAFILFVLSTADVKGFALTLGVGTLVSLFTAVLATRAALGTMGSSRIISSPAAVGAARERKHWSFDFMGASKWFFSLSGTILLIGALAIGGRGLNLGDDFTGGTRIQTGLVHAATQGQVANTITTAGFSRAQVQKFVNKSVGPNGYQISAAKLAPDQVTKVENALDSRFGVRNFSNTSIGPTFGKTIADSALVAIIASLIVISIYIALRFQWKYAVPVLIALMHDLLITAGVYALTGRQVTADTVAALLTILGYSLYDTIIVFDRVRENVPRMPRAAFSQIVNRSMSEVLTRSLATSFCTLLPIIALLLFGGSTLKDFAFALMIGVASGAYSSIFIASPVLTHWKEREQMYRNRRARITRDYGMVPAYASATGDPQADVEPTKVGRRSRRGSIIAPEAPGEQISRAEFQELVRDLDIEQNTGADDTDEEQGSGARGARDSTRRRGGAVRTSPPAVQPPVEEADAPRRETAADRDPTADALPEDVVMPSTPRGSAKPSGAKRPRNRRHGRAR
jgi:SecD/SecF fusion protein